MSSWRVNKVLVAWQLIEISHEFGNGDALIEDQAQHRAQSEAISSMEWLSHQECLLFLGARIQHQNTVT